MSRAVRDGLSRPDLLARHICLRRDGRFDDREDWFTRRTMQGVDITRLRQRCESLDWLPANRHVEQRRAGHEVPIPDVVVDGLIVAGQLAELSSRTFGNFVREFSSFQVALAGYGRAAPSPDTALLVSTQLTASAACPGSCPPDARTRRVPD